MQPFWRRSIVWLAVSQVVGIALVVGLVFVLVTAYATEHYTRQGMSQRIAQLVATVESTAQVACFTRDQTLAGEVVKGLATNGEVFSVTLVAGSEVLASHVRDAVDGERRRQAAGARVSQRIISPFDASQTVGELSIDPDPEIIRQRVRENGGFVALLLVLQLLVVAVAVIAAVLWWIVRPIKKMSDRLHVMDASSIAPLPVPDGHERTEIGRLVSDINQLGDRLVAARDDEHRQHLQREIGERKYRAIFENAESGIFVVDSRGVFQSCNQALFRQLDLARPVGRNDELSLAGLPWRRPDILVALIERCTVLNQSVSDDFEYLSGDDDVRWLCVTLTPVGDGLIQGQLTDISRHKLAELTAQQEAITDSLTGLLNRDGFLQKIEEEIAACGNEMNTGFAILIVDLDGFRRVNESMGLASGDQILSITAHRLRASLKSSDIVSRLGNDSFGIVLRSMLTAQEAANIAARIATALKGFFEIGTTPLQLGGCLGITLYPADGSDSATLLRNAEMALDHARLGGNGRYSFFDLTMARNAEHRRKLENDLRFAARRNELTILFQPIIDLPLRRMVGAEALIRWVHPEHGMIPPDIFIPLAEETGAIINIGLWIVETACQQLAAWKKRDAGHYISINISARQIPDGLPPITLIETVNRYGVDPGSLAIEITESVFMGNSDAAQTWLDAVHELGFRIYLDDFGTGYSSLSYIKRFPVDVLKVDKSFVRDMSEDNSDRALVGAIINMAGSLGLTVVAEGVESAHQLDLLERAGCRCVQGYYFSRPVPAAEIDAAADRVAELLEGNI